MWVTLGSGFLAGLAALLEGLPFWLAAADWYLSPSVAAAARANLMALPSLGNALSSGASQSGKVMAVCIAHAMHAASSTADQASCHEYMQQTAIKQLLQQHGFMWYIAMTCKLLQEQQVLPQLVE